jgi:hypothetical protein
VTNFGAEWAGSDTRCLRFARWVTPPGRKTRFRLLARLFRVGSTAHWAPPKGFELFLHLSPFPRLLLAQARVGPKRRSNLGEAVKQSPLISCDGERAPQEPHTLRYTPLPGPPLGVAPFAVFVRLRGHVGTTPPPVHRRPCAGRRPRTHRHPHHGINDAPGGTFRGDGTTPLSRASARGVRP